jgi:hypothetical protein
MRKSALVLLLLAIAAPASATISEALSLEQLVRTADHVVLATALRSQSQFDEQGRIVTDVELRVEDTMKGPMSSGHIVVVRRFGGYVGDLGMLVEGEPSFLPGSRYLVFARGMGDDEHILRAVGMSQGVMPVIAEGGVPTVQPGGHGLSLVQRARGGSLIAAPAALLRPERFELVRARITSIVSGQVAP